MNYYLILGLLLFLYMNLWFVFSLLKKRNDFADVAWGLGFIFLSWVSFFMVLKFTVKSILVCLLITVWGLRLAAHIYRRNRKKQEDYRYKEWREKWGKWFYLRSYLQVFILQGLFLFLIVSPVLIINKNSGPGLGIFAFIGALVWIIGFLFESIGDYQLSHFIKNPENKGKIMKSGLWKYSRHPNYFGEVTQWWGVWIIGLGVSGIWLGVIGPVTISILILFISGIPMLEKKYTGNAEFEEYKKTTSKFFPLPPKSR